MSVCVFAYVLGREGVCVLSILKMLEREDKVFYNIKLTCKYSEIYLTGLY